ncbi:MAG: hypothetical protein Q9217_001566 [Psora testacea]
MDFADGVWIKQFGDAQKNEQVPTSKAVPQTPKSKPPRKPPAASNVRLPSTPAKSSNNSTATSKTPKQSVNVANVRDTLDRHGMWFENNECWGRYPDFSRSVLDIFEQERHSCLKQESWTKAVKWMRDNVTSHEKDTFDEYMGVIIKPGRQREQQVPSDEQSVEKQIMLEYKSFEEDGLKKSQDDRFVRFCLPGSIDADEEKKHGLTDPKPDWTFGIRKPRFNIPGERPSDYANALIGVAPTMIHPFFIIEHKGCEGSLEKAENQAIRDGATIVNARLMLENMLLEPGHTRPRGPVENVLAFSCSWIPAFARIHVHWCEVLPNGVSIFHMNLVGDYCMSRYNELGKFRKDVHNILDWGLLVNKENAEAIVRKIVIKEKAESKKGKTK